MASKTNSIQSQIQTLLSKIPNVIPEAQASSGVSSSSQLPSWAQDIYTALGQLGTDTSRGAHLGASTAVQGLGNLIGFPKPDSQDQSAHPFFLNNLPPAVSPDLGAQQYRDQVRNSEFSPMASAFLGQTPVGDIWSDKAPLAQKQWNAVQNKQIAPGDEYSAGSKRGQGIPFEALYTTRNSPQPEQGYYSHTGGGVNNTNENDSGSDQWVQTAPAVPDPAQTNVTLDEKKAAALKQQLYLAVSDAAGGFDTKQFDIDFHNWAKSNPDIASETDFLKKPFYKDMSHNLQMRLLHARLGAAYGQAMKDSPLASYYEGILK